MYKYKFFFFLIFVFAILSNSLWLYFAYQNKTFPYYEIGKNYLKIERYFQIKLNGKDEYAKNIINKHLNDMKKTSNNSSNENVETHLLPLNKSTENITDSVNFALKGGSIAPTEKGILILDRLGRIFYYEDSLIRDLKLLIPNNLKKYLSEFSGEKINLSVDSLRAHSIEYDLENSTIYVAYSEFLEKDLSRLSVSSIKVNQNDFSSIGAWTKIYETETYNDIASNSSAAGGKILLSDNFLYLTVGNNFQKKIGNEIYISSDDLESSSGKIFKINLNTGESEIISQGHRNSQGLVILKNGFLINSEHGPQGGDELNLIEKGSHYGYPYKTFGTDYGKYTYTPPKVRGYGDFKDPIFDFSPGIGISGLIEVNGFHKKWNGNILLGSLKGRSLYRLVLSNKHFISLESIWIGSRIRDIVNFNNSIVLLTDSGELVTLTVDNARYESNLRFSEQNENIAILSKCLGCHSLSKSSPNRSAPSLHKIFNRKIGNDPFFNYSTALKNANGNWTKENLYKYLSNPTLFIPGTSKVDLGIEDLEIQKIVDILSLQ